MSNLLISVVIVTWNRKDDVLTAVQSVYDQRYENFEVIVVDNASTDGTVEALRQSYPDTNIIALDENRGASGGRNPGIEAASGDIVFILDSDASLGTDTLTVTDEKFRLNPDLGVISCKIINAFTNDLDSNAGWIYSENKKHLQDTEFVSYSFSECGCAVRKQVFDDVGLFWDMLFFGAEGEELSLRIWDAGYTICYTPTAVVYHRASPHKRIAGCDRQYYKVRNSLYMYFTRFPWWLFLLYAPLKTGAYFISSISHGCLSAFLRGLRDVVLQLPKLGQERKPVRHNTALRYLKMQREHGALSWSLAAWLRHKTLGSG